MSGWIGTEVVDALGQTHLPLKQIRRHACSAETALLPATAVYQLRGACEFERKKTTWVDRFARTRIHRRFMSFPKTSVSLLTTVSSYFFFLFLLVCLSFRAFSLGPTCERMDSWQTSRREGFYRLASRTSPVIDDWTLGDWLRLFFRGTWEIGGISFFILDTGSWNVKGEELAVNDSDNGLILSTDCHRIWNFSRILPNSTATKNEDRNSKRQFDTHKNLQIFKFFLSQIFNKYEKFSCLLKRVYIKQYI